MLIGARDLRKMLIDLGAFGQFFGQDLFYFTSLINSLRTTGLNTLKKTVKPNHVLLSSMKHKRRNYEGCGISFYPCRWKIDWSF